MSKDYYIEWVGTPNFKKVRGGRVPVAIVNHITAGTFPGCLSWMQNPISEASAHYLVTKTGRILQLVRDEDTAWHAGEVNKPNCSLYDGTNPNRYTIGIEHEGMPSDGLTEAQYKATLWLHRKLADKWRIPVNDDHIIGHYRIDSVNRSNCPGSGFPWGRLFLDLQKGEKTVPEGWKVDIINEGKVAGLITSSDHNPDEPAPKWFVLAVALNILKAVKRKWKN